MQKAWQIILTFTRVYHALLPLKTANNNEKQRKQFVKFR